MDVVELYAKKKFFVAGEDAFQKNLALQLLAYFQEMVYASHRGAYKFLLVLVGYVAQSGLHYFGQALEHKIEVLVFFCTYFAL